MDQNKSFYVCLYVKDGMPIGHRMGFSKTFPASNDPEPDAAVSQATSSSNFPAISKEFIDAMMGYLEYVPIILYLAPIISHTLVASSLHEFLDRQCLSADKAVDRTIYELRSADLVAFRRFDENLSAAGSTSRSLPRLLTVGLVTSLEYQLTQLMKEVAKCFPQESFGKEKAIAARDVVNFASMEELKEFIIYDEIDKVQREAFENQVKWITSKAGLDEIGPNYTDWPRLLELFERRNLFVHANGVVNDQYIKAAKKHNFPAEHPLRKGDELHADPDYFIAAVHRVLHFGVTLTQIVWRKCYAEEGKYSDRSISELGYELIARGQLKLAIKMLEAAKTIRGVSDIRKRMNLVNLANVYKLAGDKTKSLETLSSMDWSAVAVQFQISIAAVKDEIDEVVTLMRKIGTNSDEINAQSYQEWPVFYGVRDNIKFTDAFKEVFGLDFVPSEKRQAGVSQVMNWMDKEALVKKAAVDDGISTLDESEDLPLSIDLKKLN